jgi:hypothetical protein
LHDISDPDHVADIYEIAIPCYCACADFSTARRLAGEHDALVEPLSHHHRVHGIAVLLEVEELRGGWERILELAPRTDDAVEANLATPCVRNARSLLLTALAAAYSGDNETSRHYERRANDVATEGYDFVLAAPRTWLALLRGEIDAINRIDPVDLARVPNSYALPTAAARLDALARVNDRPLVEREAAPLLRASSYLEPFALRALGAARRDDALLGQAVARFDAMGLQWHADQTRNGAHGGPASQTSSPT